MIEIYASQRRIRMYPARVAGSILNYSFFLTIMIFFSWIWKIVFNEIIKICFHLACLCAAFVYFEKYWYCCVGKKHEYFLIRWIFWVNI